MAPAVGGSGSEASAGGVASCAWGGGDGASVTTSTISSTAATVVNETFVTTEVDVVTVKSPSPVSSFGIWRCGAGVGAGEIGDAVTIAAMGESVATGGRVGGAVSIFATGASEGSAVFGGSVGASVHPFPLHSVGEIVDGLFVGTGRVGASVQSLPLHLVGGIVVGEPLGSMLVGSSVGETIGDSEGMDCHRTRSNELEQKYTLIPKRQGTCHIPIIILVLLLKTAAARKPFRSANAASVLDLVMRVHLEHPLPARPGGVRRRHKKDAQSQSQPHHHLLLWIVSNTRDQQGAEYSSSL